MFIVQVLIHVKTEYLDEFRAATIQNATNSVKEAGIIRFDVIQQEDDPTRFILIEIYRAPEDQLMHRETDHYQVWKNRVAEMMAEPRVGVKYIPVYPDENGWG